MSDALKRLYKMNRDMDTVMAHMVCVRIARFMMPNLGANDRAFLQGLLNRRTEWYALRG